MLYQTLIQNIHRLKNASHTDHLRKEFTLAIHAMGFQQFAYVRFNLKDINPEESIYTYSEAWKIRYFEKSYQLIDPIFERAFTESQPFFWSSAHYKDDPQLVQFFKEANKYGIGKGLTTSLKAVERKKAILTCACASTQNKNVPAFHDPAVLIAFQALAETFHQMAITFSEIYDHHLKYRERQVLKLCELGMETHKIATLLNLNKDYIHEIIANALRRLGVNNRTAAVARAKEIGEIEN